MRARSYSPLTVCITGFFWLALASILGLAVLIGLVRGTPLPAWVRTLHVHAGLIGGVTQMILGGLLLLVAPPPSKDRAGSDSHPFTFWALNGGLIGMLMGSWLHHDSAVGIAGLVVLTAFLSLSHRIWLRGRSVWNSSFGRPWYYTIILFGLVGGSICGALLAFGIIPESYGYVRLAHIHLVVLGFVVMTLIGLAHDILPIVWGNQFTNPNVEQAGMILLPIGVMILIGGFLTSSVPMEIAAGVMLLTAVGLLAGNLFRTWLSSSHTGSAASDHLLVSTIFLLFTILLGILLGANNVSSPPALPYGTLHLLAYTHMAFVGFIVNAIMGAFSYLIPMAVAADRVAGHKKRRPYLDRLTTIINRWRAVQITTLSLGTMGLAILAALTWNVPLSSIYIQTAMWISLALLLTSIVLFSIKLATTVATQPEHRAAQYAPSGGTTRMG